MIEFIEKETIYRYLLPIPKDKVTQILNAEVCPIHIVTQQTINNSGNETIKYHPCHDLSFSPQDLENLSVNTRHKEEDIFNI
jgi:hypothetical protein